MAIGPVQLLVLGFPSTEATGEIAAEFQRLREHDMVRVIDALVVMKDADGEATAMQASQLTPDEQVEFGTYVGALIGLGVGGEEGMEEGAAAGAVAAAEGGFEVFDEEEAWDVMEQIPERLGRGADPHRAHLGDPAPRRRGARGRFPDLGRLHPRPGSGRHGPHRGGGGRGARVDGVSLVGPAAAST